MTRENQPIWEPEHPLCRGENIKGNRYQWGHALLLALAEHSTGHTGGWEKRTQLFPAQTWITPPAVSCAPSLPSILGRERSSPSATPALLTSQPTPPAPTPGQGEKPPSFPMAGASPTPSMQELPGSTATHQFDSYVFVCVKILPCGERHKKAMKSSPCITPTAVPEGSWAQKHPEQVLQLPQHLKGPQGMSRSRTHCGEL